LDNFIVYDPLQTTWNDVAGVYVFARFNPLTDRWDPLYIGKTASFQSRIPCHERWFQAVLLGATHILAVTVPDEPMRSGIERRLIESYQPTLNVQHRASLADWYQPPYSGFGFGFGFGSFVQ
jgi:hypothetical protein